MPRFRKLRPMYRTRNRKHVCVCSYGTCASDYGSVSLYQHCAEMAIACGIAPFARAFRARSRAMRADQHDRNRGASSLPH